MLTPPASALTLQNLNEVRSIDPSALPSVRNRSQMRGYVWKESSDQTGATRWIKFCRPRVIPEIYLLQDFTFSIWIIFQVGENRDHIYRLRVQNPIWIESRGFKIFKYSIVNAWIVFLIRSERRTFRALQWNVDSTRYFSRFWHKDSQKHDICIVVNKTMLKGARSITIYLESYSRNNFLWTKISTNNRRLFVSVFLQQKRKFIRTSFRQINNYENYRVLCLLTRVIIIHSAGRLVSPIPSRNTRLNVQSGRNNIIVSCERIRESP